MVQADIPPKKRTIKRCSTPSFIAEFPLRTNSEMERELSIRLDAGRQIYNAALGEGLRRLDLMRQSSVPFVPRCGCVGLKQRRLTMDVEQLTKILDDSKDDIVKAVRDKVIESVVSQMAWNLPGLVRKDVDEFYANEISPEVKKYLSDNKSVLMQNVIKACVDASDAVAVSMAENIKKTMENSYNAKKVFSALFGL